MPVGFAPAANVGSHPNMSSLLRFALPAAGLVLAAVIVASFAGIGYAVVTVLIGLVILGGLAAGYGVAKADETPFSPSEDTTAAGDTPEHSEVTSAVSHAPR